VTRPYDENPRSGHLYKAWPGESSGGLHLPTLASIYASGNL
jgi:hypothetical protein